MIPFNAEVMDDTIRIMNGEKKIPQDQQAMLDAIAKLTALEKELRGQDAADKEWSVNRRFNTLLESLSKNSYQTEYNEKINYYYDKAKSGFQYYKHNQFDKYAERQIDDSGYYADRDKFIDELSKETEDIIFTIDCNLGNGIDKKNKEATNKHRKLFKDIEAKRKQWESTDERR